jgi:hypothetical protein
MNPRLPSRRGFLRLAAVGGAAGAVGYAGHQPGRAQDGAAGDAGAEFITPETQAAIDRGLGYLARVQHEDGSFGPFAGGSAVGVAALAGLALMAGGHQPGRGRYARAVSKVVDFVLASASSNPQAPGLLSLPDPGGFRNQAQQAAYSHGFGALFLAEVSGMMPDPARQRAVKTTLEQAVAYTVEARNREGGWRYRPREDADVSVTVAQMMALRAARNAGVFVRKAVVDAGAEYIKGCQAADGGFAYMRRPGGLSAFARSAAAVVGLYSAGVYSGREIDRGLRYLQQFLPVRQFSYREVPPHHYYYGHYYAALAMWTAGGEYWTRWFPAIRDELLTRARQAGGTWTDDTNGSPYATAMSLIILQLPNNYLPILQK